jgi:hypothetical protein
MLGSGRRPSAVSLRARSASILPCEAIVQTTRTSSAASPDAAPVVRRVFTPSSRCSWALSEGRRRWLCGSGPPRKPQRPRHRARLQTPTPIRAFTVGAREDPSNRTGPARCQVADDGRQLPRRGLGPCRERRWQRRRHRPRRGRTRYQSAGPTRPGHLRVLQPDRLTWTTKFSPQPSHCSQPSHGRCA